MKNNDRPVHKLLNEVYNRLPIREYYGDPLLDATDRDDNLDVPIRAAREALNAVSKRVEEGNPEWGKLRATPAMNSQHIIRWGLDELRKIARPGWKPLLERLA